MEVLINSKKATLHEPPLVHLVKKIWGYEEWIVNNDKYCGKKLVLKKGYRCSLHYHKIKDETFYLLSGKIFLEVEDQKSKYTRILHPGDIACIPPLMIHRFSGIEPSIIIEFSTHHEEEDSYRIEPSGMLKSECLKSDCINE